MTETEKPNGDPAGASLEDHTILNGQALEAAEKLRQLVSDKPEALASAGLALSIAQTASIALQDAADHVRRMQILSEATYARAMQAPGDGDAQAMFDAAEKAAMAATELLSKTSETAQQMLDKLSTAT